MEIIEKAQRLRELAKEVDDISPAAVTLLASALELIEELAQGLSAAKEELEALTEQVDDLDDAFEELCEDVYGDEDGDETFEVECPNCGELIQIDEGILEEGSITCPGCD
ncbi:MAG: phage terminase large subunit family protein, partial [Firmicutes bacterium]|nr:phage terminase large subunit family protein [Bacillota bacterium]